MSPASASADKTERLLNLILALKSARRPVSKQKIRESLPAYAAATSDEAFDRMFERDKDELREMGIPITTTVIDVLFDDEVGYRIDSSETTLPAITFEPDEVAALALAARAWSTASISGAATRRPAQAAAGGGRDRRVDGRGRRAAHPHQGAGLRVRARRGVGASADHLRLPQERRRADDPARAAVGAEELARPLVPHRLRRRPRRRAGLPPQPVRGPGPAQGPRGVVCRPVRPRARGGPRGAAARARVGTAVVRVRHGRGHTLRRTRDAHDRARRALGRDRGALPARHHRA